MIEYNAASISPLFGRNVQIQLRGVASPFSHNVSWLLLLLLASVTRGDVRPTWNWALTKDYIWRHVVIESEGGTTGVRSYTCSHPFLHTH